MNKHPLSKIALVYLDSLNISPSTLKVYKISFKYYINYLSTSGILHARTSDIVNFKHYRKRLGDSSPYMNIQLAALRGLYHYLSSNYKRFNLPKSYVYNIMLNIKKERNTYHIKRHILTPKEAKTLLETTKKHRTYIWDYRNHAIVSLMLTAALRPSEVILLKLSDLNLEHGQEILKVRHAYTKEVQVIHISRGTSEAINEYLNLRKDNNPYLFISHKLKSPSLRLSNDFFRYSFKKILKTSGLENKGITPHDLRHTAGNFKLMSGAPTLKTKHFMRHVDLKSTLNYEVRLKRLEDNTEERLEDFILREDSFMTYDDYLNYLDEII
ncbi:tyrosine-type recombinase/integrase [Acholeplasma laidlawii]|uniref:tyrosine-type recombinase/integrase n=1 Tax=Acholeplasma laidlawii TaxID=2148 RepID=UPI00253FA62A|nr:tyrosine-type recombinase/integrase [Acholeplasma laidlawii]